MEARSLLWCAIVGTPKGVPSTHRMVLAAADAFYERAEKYEQTDGEQCLFSCVHFEHAFECICEFVSVSTKNAHIFVTNLVRMLQN